MDAPKQRETKPRVKYTEFDVIGPKGLKALKSSFEDFKPSADGKAPYADLAEVLEKMELWAHRLVPSMNFDDFLARTEVLGKKRAVKNYVNKLRVGVDLHDDEEVIAALQKQKQERKRDQIVIIE